METEHQSESEISAVPSAARRVGAPWQVPPLVWVLVVLLTLMLVPYTAEQLQYYITRGRERAEVEIARQSLGDQPLAEISHAFGSIAKLIGPSVVHINTTRRAKLLRSPDEALYPFGEQEAHDEGSGVIVDADGYIVTNNHVVEGAADIQVKLSDGQIKDARKIGADRLTDVAVLKIDSGGLTAAEWGDSDRLEVGAPVWAVGNPFGLDRSVTFGIVSAKNRRLRDANRNQQPNAYEDFLQTDAAVNPGNSGGPLVNIEGKVVGINTAIIGPRYQGISFSIPSSIAQEVYLKLRENGHVPRGWLGVQLDELTAARIKQFNLPADAKGAFVQGVQRDSPAEKAGIEPGDVIIEWNDAPIDSNIALSLLVGKTKIGSQAKAVLLRDGEKVALEVPVEERPAEFN